MLFAILRTVNRVVLRFKKEHQQVQLGVSEQDVNKTIQFKSAVRVPVVKNVLAEAGDLELQFDMTAPAYN